MRKKTVALSAVAAGALWAAAAQAAPIFPLPVQIGNDTGTGVIITLLPNGQSTVQLDATQGPYDGSDDTLIGVINNSGLTVNTLTLSGSDIFGFEADGLNATTVGNDFTGVNPADTTGYAGPDNTYTVVDSDNGTVNFVNPLLDGKTTFFGLENTITSVNGVNVGGVTTSPPPPPGTVPPPPTTPPPPGTSVPLPAAVWPGLAAMGALGAFKLGRKRKTAL
jgi:hypothetical protein